MRQINVPISKLGSQGLLYDSETERFDLMGYILHHLDGFPLFMLDGYAAPNDLAYAILIKQAFPGTKDTLIGTLNRLMLPCGDFRDSADVVALAELHDGGEEDGWSGELLGLMKIHAARLGYDVTFTKTGELAA